MRGFFLFLFIHVLVAGLLPISAENLQPRMALGEDGKTIFSWTGGRQTYFFKQSTDLVNWTYFPEVVSGPGHYDLSLVSPEKKLFLELFSHDEEVIDPRAYDFDKDGLSTWEELRPGGTGTDPLNAYSNSPDVRDDGSLRAVLEDPDGIGLSPALRSGLIGRWDLEEQQRNPDAPATSFFFLAYPDRSGRNHWAEARSGVEVRPEGLISKASGHGIRSTRNGLSYGQISPDYQVMRNRRSFSVAFWARILPGAFERNAQTPPYTGQGPTGLFCMGTRVLHPLYFGRVRENFLGLWVNPNPQNPNQVILRAGRYFYTNYNRNGFLLNPPSTVLDCYEQPFPAGVLDDGKWHHWLLTVKGRNGGQETGVYRDGIFLGSRHHAPVDLNANPRDQRQVNFINFGCLNSSTKAEKGSTQGFFTGYLDRLRLWDRVLNGTDARNLYQEDADGDGLWDVTEGTTRFWEDVNFNTRREDDEERFLINPFIKDPPGKDHDQDGLSSLVEQNIHQTDPAHPDTDRDGLLDGWEVTYGLDPTIANEAAEDTDGDTLTDAEEQVLGTNPRKRDTDGDKVPDAQDFPDTWLMATRDLQYDYDDYDQEAALSHLADKRLKTSDTWTGASEERALTQKIPYQRLSKELERAHRFPRSISKSQQAQEIQASGAAQTMPDPPCHHATLSHQAAQLRVADAQSHSRRRSALLYTTRFINGEEQEPEVELVEVIIPPGRTRSNLIELTPSFQGPLNGEEEAYKETVEVRLLPVVFETFPKYESREIGGERSPNWKPHDLNMDTRQNEEEHYGDFDKCVAHVWDGTSLSLAKYLINYDQHRELFEDSEILNWKINGQLQESFELNLGPEPQENKMTDFRVEVVAKGGASIDHLIITVVRAATRIDYDNWKVNNQNLDWLSVLPAPYQKLAAGNNDPEPAGYMTTTGFFVDPECDHWASVSNQDSFYHPDSYLEMRARKVGFPVVGIDGPGHQACYDANGDIILPSNNDNISAGSADRAVPVTLGGSAKGHVEKDVLPFIWAAQLDGNPVQGTEGGGLGGLFPPPNINLMDPILSEGLELLEYARLRPAVANNKPMLNVGECP